jgi:hypothetical protein
MSKYNIALFLSYFNFTSIYQNIHHHVETGSGAHPASYPMGIRNSFPGTKAWDGA